VVLSKINPADDKKPAEVTKKILKKRR